LQRPLPRVPLVVAQLAPGPQVGSLFSKKDKGSARSSPSSGSDSDLDDASYGVDELRFGDSTGEEALRERSGEYASEDDSDTVAPLAESTLAAPSASARSSSFGGGGAVKQVSAMR
jgi:hypothetical protein